MEGGLAEGEVTGTQRGTFVLWETQEEAGWSPQSVELCPSQNHHAVWCCWESGAEQKPMEETGRPAGPPRRRGPDPSVRRPAGSSWCQFPGVTVLPTAPLPDDVGLGPPGLLASRGSSILLTVGPDGAGKHSPLLLRHPPPQPSSSFTEPVLS